MARPLIQKVIKVGDSLAVVLPKEITLGLEIQRGDVVKVFALRSDQVTIKLFAPYELAALGPPLPDII
jgi:antitoxin component of MazEF toxin-antitoxin module